LNSTSSGAAGWSTPRSTNRRVFGSGMPARAKARSTSAGDSGWIRSTPNASAICRLSSTSRRGGPPTGDGSPSRSVNSSRCTSARHGRPSWPISAASSALADSAATSSRNRAGSVSAVIRARCSAYTAMSMSTVPAAAEDMSNSVPCASPGVAAGRGGGSGGTGAPVSLAQAAARLRGWPQRPAWPSSSASVSSTSWQRSTRTPARSSGG